MEPHETADNEENDWHSNQDLIVNWRRNPKQKANETSSCAQGAHQTKYPRNDEIPYYKKFPVQRHNARFLLRTVVTLDSSITMSYAMLMPSSR